MGQVRESELHLMPRPLPRQTAAAPSSRFPPLADISILAQALREGRPRTPLIGHATPLVTLFCLNGQRLKAAAAALQAELEGGGSCYCLGNRCGDCATPDWAAQLYWVA